MKIEFTVEAIGDLERLKAFVESKNPHAARRIAAELLDGIENLKRFPDMSLPVSRAPDPNRIRDLYIGTYTVRYLRRESSLVILRIWHGKESEKDT